jgi:hypothetical protein
MANVDHIKHGNHMTSPNDSKPTASLNIFWGYSGKGSEFVEGPNWTIWHHGHGPVRKIERQVDDREISADDWLHIANKAVAKMEELIDEFINYRSKKRIESSIVKFKSVTPLVGYRDNAKPKKVIYIDIGQLEEKDAIGFLYGVQETLKALNLENEVEWKGKEDAGK